MIEIKQHTGQLPNGTTVAHPVDDVFWEDAGQRRKIAVVHHAANSPIVWLPPDAPEAVKAKARKAVDKHARARDEQRNKQQDTTGG